MIVVKIYLRLDLGPKISLMDRHQITKWKRNKNEKD